MPEGVGGIEGAGGIDVFQTAPLKSNDAVTVDDGATVDPTETQPPDPAQTSPGAADETCQVDADDSRASDAALETQQVSDPNRTNAGDAARDSGRARESGGLSESGQVRISRGTGAARRSGRLGDSGSLRDSGPRRSGDSSGGLGSSGTQGFGESTSGSGGSTGSQSATSSGRVRIAPEQLIIVMGLGQCTLQDRLHEARREAGIDEKDRTTIGGLSADESIGYVRAAAKAIDLLMREHDIMHGDIKPQNILIVGGEAQVCDFGLVNKVVEDILETKHPFVTPAYGAPEVLDGTGYSKSADQYALAVSYFELRTGLLPFDHRSKSTILRSKINEAFSLEALPAAERPVLRRALSVHPKQRYPTCTQFIDELAVAAGVDKAGGLRPIRVAIGGVILATVLTWLVMTLMPDGRRPSIEFFNDAASHFEQFKSINRDYITARDPLRQSILELIEGYPNCEDPSLRRRFQELATDGADELSDLLLSELAEQLSPITGTLANRLLIDADLNLLRQLIELPGPTEDLFDQTRSSIIRDVYVAAIQRHLLSQHEPGLATHQATSAKSNASVKPLSSQDASVALSNLISNSPLGEELTTEEDRIDQGEPTEPLMTATVTLALAYRNLMNHSDVVDDDKEVDRSEVLTAKRLSDLVLAEQVMSSVSGRSVPAWLSQEWRQWRNAEGGLVDQLATVLNDDGSNDKLQQIIERGWPQLAYESALNKIAAEAENERYDEVTKLVTALRGKLAATKDDDRDDQVAIEDGIEQRLSLFERITFVPSSVEEMASASRMLAQQAATVKLADLGENSLVDTSDSLATWINAVGQTLTKQTLSSDDFNAIAQIHSDLQEVMLSINQVPPVSLDRTRLAASIRVGLPEKNLDLSNCFQIVDRLRSDSHPIATWWQVDQTMTSGEALDPVMVERLQRSLKSDANTGWQDHFKNAYLGYLKTLAMWSAGQRDAAVAAWSDASSSSDDLIEPLGPRRRTLVVRLMLEHIVESSGILRDDFFVMSPSKIKLDQALIGVAEQWNLTESNATPENETLASQLRAIERLTNDPSWPPPVQQLRQLKSLAHVRANLNAGDRALIRHLFATAKSTSNQSHEDGGIEATTHAQLTQTMLWAASAMLRTDSQRNVTRQQRLELVVQIVAPTLATARRYVHRDASAMDAGYWRIDQPIDHASLDQIAEFVDQIDQEGLTRQLDRQLSLHRNAQLTPVELPSTDWLEFAAARLGRSQKLDGANRYEHWIDAAEAFQTRLDLDGAGWDKDALRQFANYIKSADQLQPGTGQVQILEAFGRYQVALNRALKLPGDQMVDDLSKAADKIGTAINNASSNTPSLLLYTARWRHANILVALSFRLESKDKKAKLLLAASRAREAISQLADLPPSTPANPAYMALGNACEDLGHYCSWDTPDTRDQYFIEAIDSFEAAIEQTYFSGSLRPRYSLARCRLRYYQTDRRRSDQLELADKALVDDHYREDTSITSRIEWWLWKAKVKAELD
ncbi:MAG: protein kinase, partial [Planctomycetota bacterium]